MVHVTYDILYTNNPTCSHFIGRTGWNLLQDLIQARTKKLAGAYEIHKFSRDAKEILTRIKVRTNN